MKECICTLHYNLNNSKYYKFLYDYAIPTIRDYANRINKDFIILDPDFNRYNGIWNQLRCFDLLDKYDRVLYIDGDHFIENQMNLDLFSLLDIDQIGMEIHPYKSSKCKYVFSMLLIHKKYKNLFMNEFPNIKYQTEYDYTCMFENIECTELYNLNTVRFPREECLLNQVILKNNLQNKVIDLLSLFDNALVSHLSTILYNNKEKNNETLIDFMIRHLLKKDKSLKNILYYYQRDL